MHNMLYRTGLRFTLEELVAFAETCDGFCDICRDPITGRNRHLDHDANTGKLRGWLCGNCNMGIGKFKDDPQRLSAAIAYLTH
jgi:hypothetical protein